MIKEHVSITASTFKSRQNKYETDCEKSNSKGITISLNPLVLLKRKFLSIFTGFTEFYGKYKTNLEDKTGNMLVKRQFMNSRMAN